jgi:outer membrane protein assembly factor BamB
VIVAGGNTPGVVEGGRYIHAPGQPGPTPPAEFTCDSTCFYDFAPGTEVKLWSHDSTPIVWGRDHPCSGGATCEVLLDYSVKVVASFVAHRLSPAWVNGPLRGIPITDEAGNMYVGSCSTDQIHVPPLTPRTTCSLDSLDPKGKLRFSILLGSGPAATTVMGVLLSAAGLIFTEENAVLSARSTVDGSVLWRRDFTDWSLPPFVFLFGTASDGRAIFVSVGDKLAALEASTGSLRWEIDRRANSRLVVDESGNVYFAGGTCSAVSPTSCTATLTSVDNSGRLRWQRDLNADLSSPAAVAAGVLLTQAGEFFDAATGAARGKVAPLIGLGQIGLWNGAVITPDGTILVADVNDLIAYDGITGSRLWSAAAYDAFWSTNPQLTSSGVMIMDGTQVRTFGLDGSSVRGTWLEVLLGDAQLLGNGLYVSSNASAAFRLPGNPRLAEHGWIGNGGSSTGQNRAR